MSEDDEAVWRALANPTRRKLLELLRDGGRTTGHLADAFPELSRYAVMQHLGVLEEAGLLLVRREGRQRFNFLNPVPLERIYRRWMHPFAGKVAADMLALEQHLSQEDKE
jgi:DNA-binding transcriptional ArsR family regulator